MRTRESSRLYDQKQSAAFYEDRYEHGYMEEWPAEKKRMMFEVIRELHLPAQGEALDFGCGNGVLTELLRQALPAWKIYGTDISRKAVSNATERFPGCSFLDANSPELAQKRFDLLFTNHVLEHVFDLVTVVNQMNGYLKPTSSMLHFLPCGNEGSYEHTICRLREDGINAELENRFFYEDEGHVRRLTTERVCQICQSLNFKLNKAFYSNHYYGAIEWITSSHPKFVLLFSDSARANRVASRRKLDRERVRLLFITALRMPMQIVSQLLKKGDKRAKHYLLLLMALPFYVFSRPIDKYWKRKSREEWDSRKLDPGGSSMCLFFTRR